MRAALHQQPSSKAQVLYLLAVQTRAPWVSTGYCGRSAITMQYGLLRRCIIVPAAGSASLKATHATAGAASMRARAATGCRSGSAMGTKRCRVNTVCRHERAVYWFYTSDGDVIFVNLTADKPCAIAAPCCEKCASEIMRRALQIEGKQDA